MEKLETVSTTKFCVACEHIATTGSRDPASYRCFAPQNLESSHLDLVTGQTVRTWRYSNCHLARNGTGQDACGVTAIWFKERPEEPPLRAENDRSISRTKTTKFSADDL